MQLTNLIPMLNVSDIGRSIDFYRGALGFEVVSDPAAIRDRRWARIRSGNVELMLSESHREAKPARTSYPHTDRGWTAIYYFYPDDVVALYAQVIASGFEPTPLEVRHYGMREFSLIDPDGHVLSCGQQAATGNRA